MPAERPDASAPIDIPQEALAAHLARVLPEEGRLQGVQRFRGGQSNPTYLLHMESGRRLVLRRKPYGKLLKSAHAVEREYRVQKALARTEVPVAEMVHLCEDEGVIGAVFYIMAHVEGRIMWDAALGDVPRAARRAHFRAMAETLGALHRLEPEALGLGDYGPPGNYCARQIARWGRAWREGRTTERPQMERLLAWLEATPCPSAGRRSLVHGDYRLDNMIFHPDQPRILAVLDWEISTIGHPFADIAYQCMQWRLPARGAFPGLAGLDRASLGLPDEEEYLRIYCAAAGIEEIPHWPYYIAFSCFRMVAILEGILRRIEEGTAADPERGRALGTVIPDLLEIAMAQIEA